MSPASGLRSARLETVALEGLAFARLTARETADWIAESLAGGVGGWLLTANLDYLRRFALEPGAREVLSHADVVVADGTPLVWASRLKGRPMPERVAGSDLVWLLAERCAADGRSLYLLGGDAYL